MREVENPPSAPRPPGFRKVGVPNCGFCREVFKIYDYEGPTHYICMLYSSSRRPLCGNGCANESWSHEHRHSESKLWERWVKGRRVCEHEICDMFKEIPEDYDDFFSRVFSESVVYTHSTDRWSVTPRCHITAKDCLLYFKGKNYPDGMSCSLLPEHEQGHRDDPLPDFGVPVEELHSMYLELRDGRKLPETHHIALSELIRMVKEKYSPSTALSNTNGDITVVRKVGIVTHSVKM